MKAVVLHAYGDADQLRYEDVATPQPGPDEVLVKVAGTSVNPIDWKLRSGSAKARMPLQLPAILGRDVAGTVVERGANVRTLQTGQKVIGLVNSSYAEYLIPIGPRIYSNVFTIRSIKPEIQMVEERRADREVIPYPDVVREEILILANTCWPRKKRRIGETGVVARAVCEIYLVSRSDVLIDTNRHRCIEDWKTEREREIIHDVSVLGSRVIAQDFLTDR